MNMRVTMKNQMRVTMIVESDNDICKCPVLKYAPENLSIKKTMKTTG